ncbi:MAG: SO_0444 family Cu/Zn efflux transporter [Desulfatiglans sp.]|nr:SO_0444 family Cu/Zn efflux transporter [Desulfatiglans sp.]
MLPAAVSLRKQGANKGATTAFLISTPESGVDSISVTYAMMDPVMTVARPLAAFATASAAGIAENIVDPEKRGLPMASDRTCTVDACCDGTDCPPEEHKNHHSILQKIGAGTRYAITDYWGDIAGWFFVGLVLAGLIAALIPDDLLIRHMGQGGLKAMFIMLAVGMPLYICATASTPIAAALILKGVSPGAALVFLLAGPATNITSLTVLFGMLGKRATTIYFGTIALFAILCGLALDQVYLSLGLSAQAVMGKASETMPEWLKISGAFMLLVFSIRPLCSGLVGIFSAKNKQDHDADGACCQEKNEIPLKDSHIDPSCSCGCSDNK